MCDSKTGILQRPKGHTMPDTKESWERLAELYGKTITRQQAQIERLELKNNQLRQKIKQET